MPKDPLLSAEFYSLHVLTESEITANHRNSEDIEKLIKQQLYLHLTKDQAPMYYSGRHTLDDLNRFVYKQAGSSLYTDNFIVLQSELRLALNKIKNWANAYDLEFSESLTGFSRKLEQPSDSMAVLYGDGKKLLEKIAVLLHDPLIKLQERQTILINLLADNELEHCIAGCYSRINSAVLQLEANLEGNYQIKKWLRFFAKDTASYIAARRPFAIPDSYQVLVCKASNSAILLNLLHANNYLLMQAKEHGFPIAIENDPGALELGNKLTQLSRIAIVNAYIKELEEHITAKNLVEHIVGKLHENFNTIMLDDSDYTDKVTIILNKLDLIGEDSWFKQNKVGLEEIFDANNQLRNKDDLKITVVQRLIARKIIKAYEGKRLSLSESYQLEYYGFPSAIELTWLWSNGERKLLLQLIRDDTLASLIPIPNRVKQDLFPRFAPTFIPTSVLLLHALFVTDTKSLLTIIKNIPSHYHEYFLDQRFSMRIATVLKNSQSVNLFMELLGYITLKKDKLGLISHCGDQFIQQLIIQGLNKADIHHTFPGLGITYSLEDFGATSKNEALSITKELLKRLINNDFKNFSGIIFKKLPFRYLNWINFENSNFKNTKFYQFIQHSNFDAAQLDGAVFHAYLTDVSFRKTDLRKTDFQCPSNQKYLEIDLNDALISSDVFIKLRLADISDFVGANLKDVDFQRVDIKDRLKFINFSGANLEASNLSGLNMLGLKIARANLNYVNLRETEIESLTINQETSLQGSQLEASLLKYIYNLGFKSFNECKIYIDINFMEDGYEAWNFYRTEFKKTEFIGRSFYVHFVESDLSNSLFRPSESDQSKFYLSLKAIKSVLNGVYFDQVNFITTSRFKFYTLKDVRFEQVEMPASVLFSFYEAGHRDFTGVKALKGPIPQKLSAYPVWNAKLPKNVFIDLFKLGLRNFRGSDLNSFYLSQVLTEQTISAIDLKLEHAQYKSSPLGCSHTRNKRQTTHLPCSVHLLLQKVHRKNHNVITINDIESFAQSSTYTVITETILIEKPLYNLQRVNEANFYWGFRTDTNSIHETIIFAVRSIPETQRNFMKLCFYFVRPMSNYNHLIAKIHFLKNLGFNDLIFHYFNSQKNYFSLSLKNEHISTIAGTNARFKMKITENLMVKKIIYRNDKMFRRLLRRITQDVRKKIGAGKLTGQSNGAQYDLGAMLLFFIGEALSKPKELEIQSIDELTKIQLKELVPNLAEHIGHSRGANTQQIQTAVSIANRCIDQGRCATETLLITDIMDSIYRMRPDLEVGNDYVRKKIVEFFVDVGNFLSTKFTEIKLALENTINDHQAPRVGSLVANHTHMDLQLDWHEQPILLEFTKKIELTFIELGYDLEQDSDFSEINLVEALNEFCLNLTHYEQSNVISEKNITLFLQNNGYLQKNTSGVQRLNPIDLIILNDEDYVNDFIQSNENHNFTSMLSSDKYDPQRKKRSLDRIQEKSILRDEKAWDMVDKYLAKHEQPAKFSKTKPAIYQKKFKPLIQSSDKKIYALKKVEQLKKNQPTVYKQQKLEHLSKNYVIKSKHPKVEPTSKNHIIKSDQKFKPLRQYSETTKKNRQSEYDITHRFTSQLGQQSYFQQTRKAQAYVGQSQTKIPKSSDKYSFHSNQSGIFKVTAQIDMPSTLLAWDIVIRSVTREKYQQANVKKKFLQQRVEKQFPKNKMKHYLAKA